jgi:hypothetical protein
VLKLFLPNESKVGGKDKKQTRRCGAPAVCCRFLAIGNDIAPMWGTRLHPSLAELWYHPLARCFPNHVRFHTRFIIFVNNLSWSSMSFPVKIGVSRGRPLGQAIFAKHLLIRTPRGLPTQSDTD